MKLMTLANNIRDWFYFEKIKAQLAYYTKRLKKDRRMYCNKGYHKIVQKYSYFGENITIYDSSYIMQDWDKKKGRIIGYLKCKDCNTMMFHTKRDMKAYQMLKNLNAPPKFSIPLSKGKVPEE